MTQKVSLFLSPSPEVSFIETMHSSSRCPPCLWCLHSGVKTWLSFPNLACESTYDSNAILALKGKDASIPITSIVLGSENLGKIKIPTMLMGGSNDFVASVVQEQIHPFIWLTTPEKYLALSIPSGHSYADATSGEATKPAPKRRQPILQEIARTGVLRVAIRQDAAPFGSINANGQ